MHGKRLSLAILLLGSFACASGDAAHRASVSEPGEARADSAQALPSSWSPGRVWSFILLDEDGAILQRLTVRVTDRPARTCISGEWRTVEVLDEQPRRLHFVGDAAYSFEEGRFSLELQPGFCDNYYGLQGRFSDLGMSGTHGPWGWGGIELGAFYGVPIGIEPPAFLAPSSPPGG